MKRAAATTVTWKRAVRRARGAMPRTRRLVDRSDAAALRQEHLAWARCDSMSREGEAL